MPKQTEAKWLVETNPKEPARATEQVVVPAGYIDFWSLYVKVGQRLHEGFWQVETPKTKTANLPEQVAEFRRAFAFATGCYSTKLSASDVLGQWRFMGEHPEATIEDARATVEAYNQKLAEAERPFYQRYAEVRDLIFTALSHEIVNASGLAKSGQVVPIDGASWRSVDGQIAIVDGCANIQGGLVLPSNRTSRFVYLIAKEASLERLCPQSIVQPIDLNAACKDFLLSRMRENPSDPILKKKLREMTKEEGIYPSDRKFHDAYRAAIDEYIDGLSEIERANNQWGNRGARRRKHN